MNNKTVNIFVSLVLDQYFFFYQTMVVEITSFVAVALETCVNFILLSPHLNIHSQVGVTTIKCIKTGRN